MKRTLTILFGLLLGIFLILSFLDKSDYPLEKRLWRLKKQLTQVARDPKAVPDQKFEDLASRYKRLLKQYPDSKLLPGIYFEIGNIYALKKDYAKSRESLQEVLVRYAENKELCATTWLVIGSSYEAEENLTEALKTYQKIRSDYTLTEKGLNMPLYIANFYMRHERSKERDNTLREAVTFYKKTARENPKVSIGFNALRLLSTTYLIMKDAKSAVDTMEQILLDYADSDFLNVARVDIITKSINTISAVQLKSLDIPIGIYQKFIEHYPNHRMNPYFSQMIKALQALKEKNVSIKPQSQP